MFRQLFIAIFREHQHILKDIHRVRTYLCQMLTVKYISITVYRVVVRPSVTT